MELNLERVDCFLFPGLLHFIKLDLENSITTMIVFVYIMHILFPVYLLINNSNIEWIKTTLCNWLAQVVKAGIYLESFITLN